jgi:hypothetical protein
MQGFAVLRKYVLLQRTNRILTAKAVVSSKSRVSRNTNSRRKQR